MPPTLADALTDQGVQVVSTRELNRSTSQTLRRLADGRRLVITRQREPVGVLLSIRDVIALFAAAHSVRAPTPAGGSEADATAEGRLPHLAPRDRVDLLRAMSRVEVGFAEPGTAVPIWTRSGRWLAVCSIGEDGGVVVADLLAGWELERLVMGEELWRARERQYSQRSVHGRMPSGAPARRVVPPKP